MFRGEVYEWGLSFIRAAQRFSSPAFDAAMKILTHIGNPIAALVIILFIYWCRDSKKGFKLFFLTVAAFALNVCLKNIFRVPRPFVLDPSVGLIAETGFSTPSGHAQGTAAFWTLFAWVCLPKRKKTGLALALGVPFAVSFTRVYLGVHYPTDVLFGLTVGYLCALGGILFYETVAEKISPLRKSVKTLLAALLCLAFNRFFAGDVAASAALFGFALGYIFFAPAFSAESGSGFSAKRAAVTFAVGIFLCGAVYIALRFAAGVPLLSAHKTLIRFIQFALMGCAAATAPGKFCHGRH